MECLMGLSEFLFFLFYFYLFFFFRRQGFRMITFDRQAGPLQNFNRSHVMVIGRSVLFSDPARPPGGGVGRPKHPKISPPPPKNSREKKLRNFSPPPPHQNNFFFGVLRPPGTFLGGKIIFSSIFHLPLPHLHAPAQSSEHSPQSSCNNK